jgi:hypothetical protein
MTDEERAAFHREAHNDWAFIEGALDQIRSEAISDEEARQKRRCRYVNPSDWRSSTTTLFSRPDFLAAWRSR